MNTVSTETTLWGHLSNMLLLVGSIILLGTVAVNVSHFFFLRPEHFDPTSTVRFGGVLFLLGLAFRPSKKPAGEHICPMCGMKLPD